MEAAVQKPKKRLKYIDMTKGLGIFMITYGHVTALDTPVDHWMDLFKVTLFYIVAGYLISMKNNYTEISTWQYFKKLCKSLMIPYFTFSVVAILVRVAVRILKYKEYMPLLKEYIYRTISLRGISTLWFLPTLLISEMVFFYILKRKGIWKKILMGLTFIWPVVLAIFVQKELKIMSATMSEHQFMMVSFPILAWSKGLVAVWFVQMGYFGYKILSKLKNLSARFGIGIVLSVLTIALSNWNPGIDFNNMKIGQHQWIFFVGSLMGTFGALLVFEFLEKHFKLELFNYYGKNSLILMATQRGPMVINIAEQGFKGAVRIEPKVGERYYLQTLVILGIILLMEYGIIEFINHKAPFMIGRKKKREEQAKMAQ